MFMSFKSYEHFHLLLTDGKVDSHSEYLFEMRCYLSENINLPETLRGGFNM